MNVKVVDYYHPDAPKTFTDSLKETGFGVLEKHPVDWELVEAVRDIKTVDSEFLKKKRGLGVGGSDSDVKDLKHYYHCYFPWGRYPQELSDNARKLWGQLYELGLQLLKWIDANLDGEAREKLSEKIKSFTECVDPEQTLLRVLHYPKYADVPEIGDGAVRAASHEDINLITILPSASARGLQLLQNGEWHEVPCRERSIVVNIGDMLQEATGGVYKSTTHRVMVLDPKDVLTDRLSTPCFVHAKPDTWLSEKYPRAQMYLFERLRELGVMPPEEPSAGAEAEAAAVEEKVAGARAGSVSSDVQPKAAL